MTKKAVTANGLWAPIIPGGYGEERIDWACVNPTRLGAKSEYLRGLSPECWEKALTNVRFAKVTITEVVPSAPEGDLE